MTMPQVPPVDPGNPLLSEQPVAVATTVIQTGGGPRVAVTIRSATTTMTIFLKRSDAENIARQIIAQAGHVSASGLIVAPPGR